MARNILMKSVSYDLLPDPFRGACLARTGRNRIKRKSGADRDEFDETLVWQGWCRRWRAERA